MLVSTALASASASPSKDQNLNEFVFLRAVFKFEGARIICAAHGSDFTEFRTHFADEERAFGYLR
jgi:hypothetical protein